MRSDRTKSGGIDWSGALPITLGRVLIAAGFLTMWEIAGHTVFDPEFLSPPSAILIAMPKLLSDPQVLSAIGQTMWQLALALLIALVLGLVLGLAVGLSSLAPSAPAHPAGIRIRR